MSSPKIWYLNKLLHVEKKELVMMYTLDSCALFVLSAFSLNALAADTIGSLTHVALQPLRASQHTEQQRANSRQCCLAVENEKPSLQQSQERALVNF